MHIQVCLSFMEKVEHNRQNSEKKKGAFQIEKNMKNSYKNKYYIVPCREEVGKKVEQIRKKEIINGLKYQAKGPGFDGTFV